MDKRCGLPSRSLSTPKNFARACPSCSRLGHSFGAWKAGKNAAAPAGPPATTAQARPAGVGRSRKEKKRKADMTVMVMSAFLMAASRQRKACRSTADLPRLQRRDAAGGTGRAFSGPSARACAAFSGSHPCMGSVWKRRTGRAIGTTGYWPSGAPVTTKRRRVRRCTGGSGRRQQGPWPPCPTVFF